MNRTNILNVHDGMTPFVDFGDGMVVLACIRARTFPQVKTIVYRVRLFASKQTRGTAAAGAAATGVGGGGGGAAASTGAAASSGGGGGGAGAAAAGASSTTGAGAAAVSSALALYT